MVATISRWLPTWFGKSDGQGKSLVPPTEGRQIPEEEAIHSASATDWKSIGWHNYGHWCESASSDIRSNAAKFFVKSVAERMGQLNEREAAHVVRLLPANDQSVYGRQGVLGQWRDEINTSFRNLASYDGEIYDGRVKVHLEEVTPTNDEISISSIGKWQKLEAGRLHKKLRKDTSVLEVTTMGTFGIDGQGHLHGAGEIVVESVRPIRESCEMGPHVISSSDAELAAILRGLSMVRDTFQDRGDSREFRQYRRVIIATGSIMGLRAIEGSIAHGQSESELKRTTRIAAMCRMEAAEILKIQQNIDSVHFIWLPPSAGAIGRS